MQQDPSESFWRWCLGAYARPGVARAALRLQDRHGASVMVLLWLCWRQARGIGTDATQLRGVHACAALLECHALVPLRAARRALAAAGKRTGLPGPGDTARRVLAAELGIERLQAARLAMHPASQVAADAAVAPAALLSGYLGLLGADTARSRAIAGVLARRVGDMPVA